MTAPAVGFGADVATAEDFEVTWELNEFLDDLKFVHAAQKAEIMNLFAEIVLAVIFKISFELVALGILMIDGRTGNIALIRGSLITDNDVLFVV